MKNYPLTGFVIKRINVGEADRIIILFSEEKGKVRALAKNIRKINSKRSPHLEIFSQVKVLIHEGKNYSYIVEAQLINGFLKLRKDLRKVRIAYHLCEIIEKLLPEREYNGEIYKLYLNTLTILENGIDPLIIRQEVRFFVNQFLLKLGYLDRKKSLTYSQLIFEIEYLIEQPLSTLRFIKHNNQNTILK